MLSERVEGVICRSTVKVGWHVKPIIGICSNFSRSDAPGLVTGVGLPGQTWQLIATDYVHAVEAAGGCPVILPLTGSTEVLWPMVTQLNGIIFTGGSDVNPLLYNEAPRNGLGDVVPERDTHEMALFKRVLEETAIPVLGICRGLQLINVALGGSLYQDIGTECQGDRHRLSNYPKHVSVHEVRLSKGSWLSCAVRASSIWTNSFHHQGVKTIGKGIEVVALAADGMAEGLELVGERFVTAVQWHPEMMFDADETSRRLFKAFIEVCGGRE